MREMLTTQKRCDATQFDEAVPVNRNRKRMFTEHSIVLGKREDKERAIQGTLYYLGFNLYLWRFS